jgi:penicillin-binding protein 2
VASSASRFPRRLTSRRDLPLVEPVSSAEAPFHHSAAFYVRVGGLAAVALALLGVLALRLWSLQVLRGPKYEQLASRQAYRTVDLPGPRGAIVDAKGRLLAGTNGRLVVTADPGTLGSLEADGGWQASQDGLAQLQRVSRLSRVPLSTLVERVEHAVVRSPFAPAVVLPHPSRALAFYLAERAKRYRSFRLAALPSRNYPQGGLGSEFLGLLGEVSPEQLATAEYAHARAGETVGQSGVEAMYDRRLNGGFTRARLPVDSQGRIVGPLTGPRSAKPLPTLHLTIDARIQRAAERAIRDGIELAHGNGHTDATAGAAIVMNARTGALYALASYPDYNQLLAARAPGYYTRLLRADPAHSKLINRATQGLYPVGSTFKPIVAEAALAAGLISPWTQLLCSGSFTIGGFTFHNVEAGVYSYMPLPTALAESCDTWFYRLGERFYLRQEAGEGLAMQQWARMLGLGGRTGLDLPDEAAGIVPTPRWLQRTWHQNWYEGQSINLSIGQGYLAVTPLQLAVAYAALANGGRVVTPHVAAALGSRVLHFPARRHVKLRDVWAIRNGLFAAAHAPGGTSASVFGNFRVPVAGKTGTAQAPSGSDHSWYASWAPAGHPQVVVVVLVEHGGFGAQAAAPAAREIYSAFFRPPRRRR